MTTLLIHTTALDLRDFMVTASTFLVKEKKWKSMWKELRETKEKEYEIYKSIPPNEYIGHATYDKIKSSFTIIKTNPNGTEVALVKEIMKLNEKSDELLFMNFFEEILEKAKKYAMEKICPNITEGFTNPLRTEFYKFKNDKDSDIKQLKLFVKKKNENISSPRSLVE